MHLAQRDPLPSDPGDRVLGRRRSPARLRIGTATGDLGRYAGDQLGEAPQIAAPNPILDEFTEATPDGGGQAPASTHDTDGGARMLSHRTQLQEVAFDRLGVLLADRGLTVGAESASDEAALARS